MEKACHNITLQLLNSKHELQEYIKLHKEQLKTHEKVFDHFFPEHMKIVNRLNKIDIGFINLPEIQTRLGYRYYKNSHIMKSRSGVYSVCVKFGELSDHGYPPSKKANILLGLISEIDQKDQSIIAFDFYHNPEQLYSAGKIFETSVAIGKSLPQLETHDLIHLIYDSDNQELSMEYNRVPMTKKITSLPKDVPVSFFFGIGNVQISLVR